ncbi:hypothetical protein [Pseudosulfitobacter koreensis]|uniref:SMI1-KNR4 cell-wall n=1 Tax=Pseudosulfitobacter koreensis TaxID=2968472 RepID=A0ABT1YY57_9RHOB|nr:hypothetical protein [Pseudosulfitobacter koreense]MCR8825813.1 hypothetical protein [Pseudosulfitobacter koreense]
MKGVVLKNEIGRIVESDSLDELASLTPLDAETVADIQVRHPNISVQYLDFIRTIGVGTTTNEMHIYQPQPIAELSKYTSFKIYNSKSARQLFGLASKKAVFPSDAVVVADSGASWRYCLRLSDPDTVFVADMMGPTFEPEASDFFTFVRKTLILGS